MENTSVAEGNKKKQPSETDDDQHQTPASERALSELDPFLP